jgi:P-type E1-E2 ATPase
LIEIAAIEAASGHPIASAFRHIAPATGVSAVRNLPGAGVEARIGPATYRIGNDSLLTAEPPSVLRDQLPEPSPEARELFILRDGIVIGIARLREQLRVSSLAIVSELEAAGITCAVLTGDQTDRAHDLPRIETGLSPEAKANRIREMSATERVLFVGDGVNDAPAMAEAHVSLSLASGSPLARETATGELVDLRAIPFAIARCRAAVRAIRQNLRFAIAYNLIGISLAAVGILHPVAAALLMLASSFTVSWRALRPVRLPLTPVSPSAPLVSQPA